jgi:flagellar motor protein MotB
MKKLLTTIFTVLLTLSASYAAGVGRSTRDIDDNGDTCFYPLITSDKIDELNAPNAASKAETTRYLVDQFKKSEELKIELASAKARAMDSEYSCLLWKNYLKTKFDTCSPEVQRNILGVNPADNHECDQNITTAVSYAITRNNKSSQKLHNQIKTMTGVEAIDYYFIPNYNGKSTFITYNEANNSKFTAAGLPSITGNLTITGTVYDSNDDTPLVSVNVRPSDTPGVGMATDMNGKFEIKNFPPNEKIIISYVGYGEQRVNPGTDLKIYLKETTTNVGEVDIKGTQTSGAPCGDAYYKLDSNASEEDKENVYKNYPQLKNSTSAVMKKQTNGTLKCFPAKCIDGYTLNHDGTECVLGKPENPGFSECSATYLKAMNAKSGKIERDKNNKDICVITACINDQYDLVNGACQLKSPKEQSEKNLNELRNNAQAMKDKEQSIANRTLGAISTGATSIGAMNAMSGLAEQRADTAAERDMRAYLASFRCEYGAGSNIHGGETDIMLPGGNDLAALWMDYVTLANQLKETKESLGIRAGIESEIIIDKANSGLYDNAAVGKVGGGYTSLARALMDPTGADAAAWAQQTAAAKEKTKTGMITAAVGIGIGIVGNLVINGLSRGFKKLEHDINNPPEKQSCPDGTTPTIPADPWFPNCKCTDVNARFSPDVGNKLDEYCQKCPGDLVYNNNNDCVCPADRPVLNENNNTCRAPDPQCPLGERLRDKTKACDCVEHATRNGNVCQCNTANGFEEDNDKCVCSDAKGFMLKDNKCVCKPNFRPDGDRCVCQDGYESNGNDCIPIQPVPPPVTFIRLKSDALFDSGKHTLKSNAITAIDNFRADAESKNDMAALAKGDHCIVVFGHADRDGWPSDRKNSKQRNQKLSEDRANTVYKKLMEGLPGPFNSCIKGFGQTKCTNPPHQRSNDPECRRVDILITNEKCNCNTGNEEVLFLKVETAAKANAAGNQL